MATLRRHLSLLAVVWTLFQTAGIAAPLVAIHVNGGVAEQLCTCTGDDHATCPMHHAPLPPVRDGGCTLKTSCASNDAALVSLFSVPGVVPASALIIAPDVTDSSFRPAALNAPSHVELLDAPPPRA